MSTLDDVIRLWLQHVQQRFDLAASTKVSYARIARHLELWARGRPAGTVDMASYAIARTALGIAPRTLRLEFRVASAAFRWGQRQEFIPGGARLDVPRVRVDAAVFRCNHRTPTAAEVARVTAVMSTDDWRVAVELLARTGARIGEVVQLRFRDLDVAGARVALGGHAGAAKTGLRWFPLDEHSLAALRGRVGAPDSPLLTFGSSRSPIQGIQRRLMAACALAGEARFTPHSLRRMVVTRLLRAGVDAGTAASLTGHTVQVMLRHYQQVNDDDRRAAVDRAELGRLDIPIHQAGQGGQAAASVSPAPPAPRVAPSPRDNAPSNAPMVAWWALLALTRTWRPLWTTRSFRAVCDPRRRGRGLGVGARPRGDGAPPGRSGPGRSTA